MQIAESNISVDRRVTIISIVFVAWLITLPLGAKLLALDLGPITIYPNFICGLILAAMSNTYIPKWNKFVWFSIGFFVVWFLQSVIQFQGVKSTYVAKFDVRSLFLQLVFALSIITSYYALGYERFQQKLILGLKFILILLLLFGFFEATTGIHLNGATTGHYLHFAVSNVMYAPMFVFDNVNDYLAYTIVISLLLLILDANFRKMWMVSLGLFAILYYFSDMADSRFGKFICFHVMLFCVIAQTRKSWKQDIKQNVYIVLGVVVVSVFLLVSNNMYFGPKYRDGKQYRLNELRSFDMINGSWKVKYLDKELSKVDKYKLVDFLDSLEVNNPSRSDNSRTALIENGLDFIKESPVLGIGPGQFIQRHVSHNVKRDIGTLTSAHCFPIEIISQFGLIAWGYFVLLGCLFVAIALEFSQLKSWNPWVIILGLMLPLIWCMPSSFLYFDIHKLLFPLLLVYWFSLRDEANEPV